jgi:hypothetical protein
VQDRYIVEKEGGNIMSVDLWLGVWRRSIKREEGRGWREIIRR